MTEAVVKFTQICQKLGYEARAFGTAQQMKEAVLSQIAPDAKVGIGGSMTVEQLGLYDALVERGNNVYWHWKQDDKEAARRSAATADVYLMSTNAATQSGQLINIDGTGNRVAALCYGPKDVYILMGRNKLTADTESGIQRIKTEACPKNAQRLGLDTPCARIGRCVNCASRQRMCQFTVITDRPPAGKTVHVYVADEDLGY